MKANAQYTLRGDVVHVQIGQMGDYTKRDIRATPELIAYFNEQVAAGNYGRSFYDSDTKYVPVMASEEKVTVFRIAAVVSSLQDLSVSESVSTDSEEDYGGDYVDGDEADDN